MVTEVVPLCKNGRNKHGSVHIQLKWHSIFSSEILLDSLLQAVLQIRRGNRDNLENFPYFSIKTLFCDPPLELSPRDSSNEWSQHMFRK